MKGNRAKERARERQQGREKEQREDCLIRHTELIADTRLVAMLELLCHGELLVVACLDIRVALLMLSRLQRHEHCELRSRASSIPSAGHRDLHAIPKVHACQHPNAHQDHCPWHQENIATGEAMIHCGKPQYCPDPQCDHRRDSKCASDPSLTTLWLLPHLRVDLRIKLLSSSGNYMIRINHEKNIHDLNQSRWHEGQGEAPKQTRSSWLWLASQ